MKGNENFNFIPKEKQSFHHNIVEPNSTENFTIDDGIISKLHSNGEIK